MIKDPLATTPTFYDHYAKALQEKGRVVELKKLVRRDLTPVQAAMQRAHQNASELLNDFQKPVSRLITDLWFYHWPEEPAPDALATLAGSVQPCAPDAFCDELLAALDALIASGAFPLNLLTDLDRTDWSIDFLELPPLNAGGIFQSEFNEVDPLELLESPKAEL